MAKITNTELSFEQAMLELEAIVEKMENGNMSLQQSVDSYTRGTELAGLCRKQLELAEAKIQKLGAADTLAALDPDGEEPA